MLGCWTGCLPQRALFVQRKLHRPEESSRSYDVARTKKAFALVVKGSRGRRSGDKMPRFARLVASHVKYVFTSNARKCAVCSSSTTLNHNIEPS